MPYPCFQKDYFFRIIQSGVPVLLIISFIYSVAVITQTIVLEKELRLKEVMKIMGLNNSVHLFAWFITYFVQLSIVVILLTIILSYGKILTHSDPVLIFIILEIFCVATICFSFLISAFFSEAKIAAGCAGIIYFISYLPNIFITIHEEIAHLLIPWWSKCIASFFSATSFGIASKYIAYYENNGIGIQWSNINESPIEKDTFNCLICIKMMIIDCFIYWILAWYIENVRPSYGIPLPWNYPFTLSFWLGTDQRTSYRKPKMVKYQNQIKHELPFHRK